MFKKLLAFVAAMYVAVAFAAVDVNTATPAELDAIKGIGPVKSALIISERKKAPFKDWNDFVTRVKGVGTDSAAKFSADGLTVNGTSYKAGGKTDVKADKKADKPVTEKAKDAAVATKDAVKGAAIATKDAAKETAKDVKAAVTPKTDTKAEVKAEVKAGAKTEPAKK
ncbi:helix-hairpin-helix domain-containing protein [Polaromonas sp. YR568]|uniref:helix-hairpin-helix domain-containing protein n=1 Tax=Polaromonas sp. YR568 TaxID=1855301 RepID=UPI003137C678